jgi:hypothetical protein
MPQRVSIIWKGTCSARYGRVECKVRAPKSHNTIARLAFAAENSLRGIGQTVEADLDRAGLVRP